ncbi:transient receptor potential channel pyrexia-like [Pristis pectinata]|uniref:transient receptor potential channel pyrexia-like n=1 Tax=Pristis pectinata TaxID=685728 RepID=UPI00223D842E|nr:transient receptor potential channel pyrexia-like [Pristis pectinata]
MMEQINTPKPPDFQKVPEESLIYGCFQGHTEMDINCCWKIVKEVLREALKLAHRVPDWIPDEQVKMWKPPVCHIRSLTLANHVLEACENEEGLLYFGAVLHIPQHVDNHTYPRMKWKSVMSLKKSNQVRPPLLENVPAVSKSQEVQAKNEVVAGSGNTDCEEDKWSDYVRQRRAPHKHIPFKTDAELESTGSATYIGLKRNTDAGQQIATSNQTPAGNVEQKSTSASPTAAFLQYFITTSKRGNDSQIDLERLNTLLENGADINATDRYGQGVLHGAARTWHPDVARFLIERNANVNKSDNYGVTPLHVAAATDYPEMVDFLLDCDADIEAKTTGMMQTPVHYAAKYDAASSLNCLLKHDADINTRDYKQRTPLQLAAELDRTESARLLLQFQADAGTHDNTGQLCLTLMAANMPQLALTALDQFCVKDRANRKQYFMLNMLIPQPSETSNSHAKSLLEVIVQFRQLDLIMHPVVQKLITIKWKRFGMRGVGIMLTLNILFIISWTVLGLSSSLANVKQLSYELPGDWWRVLLATIAIGLTAYQIGEEFIEIQSSNTKFSRWKEWRAQEIMKDLNLCHPRWPEEEAYLKKQLTALDDMHPHYFNDFWNLFDWMVYLLLFALIGIYIADLSMTSETIHTTHIRLCAVTIIFLWLRVMKHVRAIRALGPFIVMLGKIIVDLLKFLFLYGEFYIPFACSFWIMFGGLVPNMSTIPQMLFTVFRITLVDDYGFEDMYARDPVMAYLLCGTFLGVSSILCINLLIALLSDTFQRVYDNANANAAMQQASIVLYVEDHLNKKRKNTFQEFIHTSCAPLEIFFDDDITIDQEDDLKKVTVQIKEDIDNLTNLMQKEEWERAEYEQSPGPRRGKVFFGRGQSQNQDEE